MHQTLNLIRLEHKPVIFLSDISCESIDIPTFIDMCMEAKFPEHRAVSLMNKINMSDHIHNYYEIIVFTIIFNKQLMFGHLLDRAPDSWSLVLNIMKCIIRHKCLNLFKMFMQKYYVKPHIYRSNIIIELNKNVTFGYHNLMHRWIMETYPQDFPACPCLLSIPDIQILIGQNDNIPSEQMNDVITVCMGTDLSELSGISHLINTIDKWDISQTNLTKLCNGNITVDQFNIICDKRDMSYVSNSLCHEYLISGRIDLIEIMISRQLCDYKFIQYLVFTRLNQVTPVKHDSTAHYVSKITTDQDIYDLVINPDSCWSYNHILVKRLCKVKPELWNEINTDEDTFITVCCHCPDYNIILTHIRYFENIYKQGRRGRICDMLLDAYHIIHIRFSIKHEHVFEFRPTKNSLFRYYTMLGDITKIKSYLKNVKKTRK